MKWSAWRWLAATPATVMALVAHAATCPACWPIIGGVMSALGVTSVIGTKVMLPLFVGFLLLGMTPLGAAARRHPGPLLVGLVAAVLMLIGKFVLQTNVLTFGGIAVLASAYFWSYRLGKRQSCSRCTVPVEEIEQNNIPIACALDKERFAERKALLERLAQEAVERRSVPSGFAFRFGSESGVVNRLANFVELERTCCPFLNFQIKVNAAGTVWLELTGPKSAQEIIRELAPRI